MKKEAFTNTLGVLFLLLGITAVINTYIINSFSDTLWLCYFGLTLIGIGALLRNSYLIKAQLNILSIPLIIWGIDFFWFIFSGSSLFGIVDYLFKPGPLISKTIAFQHLFTIPLGIILLKKINKKTNFSWIISLVQVSIIFAITRIFADSEKNINWVHETSLNLNIPFYPLFWLAGMFVIIFSTDKILKKLFRI